MFAVPNTVETVLDPDDQYTAQGRAVDVAGNTSTADRLDFVVDLDPPTQPTDLAKDPASLDDDRTPTFNWQTSQDLGLGVDLYRLHIESVSLIDVIPPPAPVPVQARVIAAAGKGFVKSGDAVRFRWSRVTDKTSVFYRLEVATGAQPATGSFTSNLIFAADVPHAPVAYLDDRVIQFVFTRGDGSAPYPPGSISTGTSGPSTTAATLVPSPR